MALKSIMKSILAVVPLFFISCSEEVISGAVTKAVPMTFEASFDSDKITRSIRNDNGEILWGAHDVINVFCGTNAGMFTSTNDAPAATATFSGSIVVTSIVGGTSDGDVSSDFWGVYPYNQNATCDGVSITTSVPVNQYAVANTYDPKSFVSVAKSETNALRFYNACSLMKFRLSTDNIRSITIETNGNEVISGDIKLVVDESHHPVVADVINGSNKIVLHAGESSFLPNTDYFFSMLPGVLPTGFTITFDNGSQIARKVVTRNVEFERSITHNVGVLDENLSYENKVLSKNGFLCFRTDDNQIRESIVNVFEKYGFKYSMAINILKMSDEGSTSLSYLRELQDKGYQVCDHTPNHNTLYVDVLNSWLNEFDTYSNTGYYHALPLQDGERTRLYLTREYNVNPEDAIFGGTNSFTPVPGTSMISGDFSGARQIDINTYPTFLSYCYIPQTNGTVTQGWYLVKSVTPSSLTLARLDVNRNTTLDQNTLQFSSSSPMTVYLIQEQGYTADKKIKVTLTEDAQYVLMKAGQKWFEYYGLDKPKVWVQPGGDHPWGTNEYIETALTGLNMDWAETQDNVRNLTYNYENNYSSSMHTGTWWDDIPLHLDKINDFNSSAYITLAKEKIADYYALNNIRTIGSHYRWNNECSYSNPDAERSLVQYVESLVKFFYDNNIPMVTFSERKRLLQDKSYDHTVNIIPPLNRDLCGRGKPDGYTLSNGSQLIVENSGECIKSAGSGLFCEIFGLGALEKQSNNFKFRVKGNWSGYVVIYSSNAYKPNYSNPDALQQLKVFSFTSSSNEYVEKQTNFTIPQDANYLWIRFISSSSNEGYLKDLSLTPIE